MEHIKKRQLSFVVAFSTAMLVLLVATRPANAPAIDIITPQKPSSLKIITRPSLHTFHEGKDGPDGMEFQLIQSFAQEQNIRIELILTDNSDAIYSALDSGLADIALLGQPLSIERRDVYPKSPAYREVTLKLLQRNSRKDIQTLDELAGKSVVVRNTEQNRIKYRYLKAFHGSMEWQFSDESMESLLTKLNRGEIDYTLTDSMTYALKHPLFPGIRTAMDISQPQPVSLVYSPRLPEHTRQLLNNFIVQSKQNGSLTLLMERFYGHATDIDNNGYRSFSYLMRNRLPQFQQSFMDVAKFYKMDWRLLASIAYQESHWDPEARSPTGVRGLMMLTYDTALEMGVEDRVDSEQSLRGGARYFNRLLSELPPEIQEPDRTWIALASYNVGLGHVFDAMSIASRKNLNPYSWHDLKKCLPLLSKKEWHSTTRYGYARGWEPVDYVQNIRRYYDILAWRFPLRYNEKSAGDTQLIVKTLDEAIQENTLPISAQEEKQLQLTSLFF